VDPAEIKKGPPVEEVDRNLISWLEDRGIGQHQLRGGGWGVTMFDLPFVIPALPGFTKFLSHHTVELNAVCYSLGNVKTYLGEVTETARWKRMAKYCAEVHLAIEGRRPDWHDAGYDALASLLSWQWLRAVIADPDPGSGQHRAAPVDPLQYPNGV
jgi:hypothetical protein